MLREMLKLTFSNMLVCAACLFSVIWKDFLRCLQKSAFSHHFNIVTMKVNIKKIVSRKMDKSLCRLV